MVEQRIGELPELVPERVRNSKISMVIVDGNAFGKHLVASILLNKVDSLKIAGNMDRALEFLRNGDINLLFMGSEISGKKGSDFKNRLRREFPDLPIIWTSASFSHDGKLEQSDDQGIDFTVGYPPTIKELQIIINKLENSLASQSS